MVDSENPKLPSRRKGVYRPIGEGRAASPYGKAKTVKNSWSSPKNVKTRQRITEALEYRRQGYSYDRIGQTMRISTPYAHELVLRGMDMVIQEPAEVVLQMELARLDAMMASVYTRAVEGDKEAINTVLKIMDRRQRLLGLDKLQAKTESQIPSGVDITVTFVSADGIELIDAEYARAMAITGRAPASRDGPPSGAPPAADEEGEV
jgi:hypothetical protein